MGPQVNTDRTLSQTLIRSAVRLDGILLNMSLEAVRDSRVLLQRQDGVRSKIPVMFSVDTVLAGLCIILRCEEESALLAPRLRTRYNCCLVVR
jgi:hypothetical protein